MDQHLYKDDKKKINDTMAKSTLELGRLEHEIDTKFNGIYAWSSGTEEERKETRYLMKKAIEKYKNK